MELISQVCLYFLIVLAFGTMIYYPIVDSKLTGVGYVKLTVGVVAGTLVVASLISLSSTEASLAVKLIYGFIFLALSLMYFLHRESRNSLSWFLYAAQMTGFMGLGHLLYSGNLAQGLFFFSSVLFMGVVHYKMILGHYYLVVPKLTERPLIVLTYIFWGALVVKLGLSTYGLIQGWGFFQEGTELGMGYMFNWVLLTMRVLWGYVALFVLSIFAFKLCRMRSIQSATGLFYVMVFFVFVGELISYYLFLNYGLLV